VFVFVALVSLFVAAVAAAFWSPLTRLVYRGAPPAAVVMSLLSFPGLLLIYVCEGLWIALGRMGIVAVVRLGQRFGLTTHPGGLAEYALDRSDSVLVGYLLPFSALGFYSLAVPVAELVWY